MLAKIILLTSFLLNASLGFPQPYYHTLRTNSVLRPHRHGTPNQKPYSNPTPTLSSSPLAQKGRGIRDTISLPGSQAQVPSRPSTSFSDQNRSISDTTQTNVFAGCPSICIGLKEAQAIHSIFSLQCEVPPCSRRSSGTRFGGFVPSQKLLSSQFMCSISTNIESASRGGAVSRARCWWQLAKFSNELSHGLWWGRPLLELPPCCLSCSPLGYIAHLSIHTHLAS